MSKSLGNVVDPVPLAATYGVEPVKYYLLRQLPISQDGDFCYAGLEQHINADLVVDWAISLTVLLRLQKNMMYTQ
jgi:methionyl-tRNA synthetase